LAAQAQSELLSYLGMVALVNVVKYAAARHLNLGKKRRRGHGSLESLYMRNRWESKMMRNK
jgi:hypothetical protein